MWIKKNEIDKLSGDIRKIIDGQTIDLRDNREGCWGILKNDIHTLASLKNEQVDLLGRERDIMGDTLANISHQIKTPLTSMTIMVDLLESVHGAGGLPPDKQAEFLSNIKIGLARMDWLASALLKMAKLDAGAVEFSSESIRSDALVNLALEPLQILLDVKNQSVETSGEIELFCDKRWTAEALSNVVKNASEYSPEGGTIQIESGMNPICRWISVTDGGKGISSAEMAVLFKRFESSRCRDDRPRSSESYGIGLPLALAIMRGQNGDIEVNGGGGGGENSGGSGGDTSTGATFTLKFYATK